MPAKHLTRVGGEGTYSHIYNSGIEKRIIFNDDEDYEVFISYLRSYLSPPVDPASTKKTFTVKGREFKGTPHLPKNYFNKVELLAYNLMPNHYHLLLHQKSEKSIENFIRSLCTRYSMYFNKKYNRNGSLFQGPYRSAHIKNSDQMILLANYLQGGSHTSLSEYLKEGSKSWINTDTVKSLLKNTENYKELVENFEPSEKEKEILNSISPEDVNEHLRRRHLDEKPLPQNEANPANLDPSFKGSLASRIRLPETVSLFAVFLILLILGINNVQASSRPSVLSASSVASASPVPTPSPETELKKTLTIKIADGSLFVNIRQKPTIASEVVRKAENGETFEFVSVNSGWYEIRLENNQTGFVSSIYASPKTNN